MKKIRMGELLLITVLLMIAIACIAPQQLPVVAYKALQVTLFGWIGYWIDRLIAPYARPDNERFSDQMRAAANLRRALIVAGAMIAGALGA